MSMTPRTGCRAALRRGLLCLLALVLLLQASVALMAATLGPRHSHASELPQAPLLDLRRGVVMTSVLAVPPGRSLDTQQGAAQRHHHGAAEAGVEHDAAAWLADGQAAAAAMLLAWFPLAPSGLPLAPPPRAHAAPLAGPGWFVASAEQALPERPPRAPRLN